MRSAIVRRRTSRAVADWFSWLLAASLAVVLSIASDNGAAAPAPGKPAAGAGTACESDSCAPSDEAPAEDPPAEDAGSTDPAADDLPPDDLPSDEAPSEEPPADEAPTDEPFGDEWDANELPGTPPQDESPAPGSPEESADDAAPDSASKSSSRRTRSTDGAASDAGEATAPRRLPTAEEQAADPPLPTTSGSLSGKIKEASAGPKSALQPAEFQGVRPGLSTVTEVDRAWGPALEIKKQNDALSHSYHLEAFRRVDAHFYRDRLQTLVVHLEQQVPADELARRLELTEIDPVLVNDEEGEVLGAAFPERGVVFAFDVDKRDRPVAQVIIEAIDPQAFVLRAHHRLAGDYTRCLNDLAMAVDIDPESAPAHGMQARLLTLLGQHDAAIKAADRALRLKPKEPEFLLVRAELWAKAGQFSKAIDQTKQALALCEARPEIKAQALNQLGDQLAAAPGRDYQQAMQLHGQAIKLAEPLVKERRVAVRKAALEALIAAHLSAARDIAWGNWKQKPKVVPHWLNRAEELANQLATEEAGSDLPLRVCRDALDACVGMEGDLDPTPWADKALAIAKPAIDEARDPLRKRQLQWQLGAALYDALQVYHVTSELDSAVKYGTLAADYLEAGAADRQLDAVEAYLLGRFYFRMGAVFAVHARQPQKAVIWFEKAIPLLERPVPPAALADAGRHGEGFVSMAVSYWSVGSHDEALRLTRQGVKLMEQAVKDGIIGDDALHVPYTNLATMHRFLGDDEQAAAFSEMATKSRRPRGD